MEENYANRIKNIKSFVEKNSNKDSIFLDLTNRGMHYLYLNKKIPIKFISFYNAISSKQSEQITEKLSKNPPDIILIDSNSILHDNIHLGLRLNSFYKWLVLSNKYKLITERDNTYLVKHHEKVKYSKEELNKLDNILGQRNLNFLPEAWGNSINNLPLNEVKIDSYNYTDGEQLKIKFTHPISGESFDFIYIEPINNTNNMQNFYIQINNSDSEILCKSKRNSRMLIPFDNYPSWLLNDKIEEINIYSNKEFERKYIIKFYKRET